MMDKEQIAKLLYKFVKDTESEYSFYAYMDKSFELDPYYWNKKQKDVLLKEYIDKFIEEFKPAPKHFYLRLVATGEILSFTTTKNEGDCCCELEYQLNDYGEAVWEAESLENAVWVKYNPTMWYNADYETPNHYYQPFQLEVVDEYRTIYDDKPMSDLEYATLYYKVYNDDDYLKQIKKRVERETDYNPEESYNNSWYSIKCLKQAEGRKDEKRKHQQQH